MAQSDDTEGMWWLIGGFVLLLWLFSGSTRRGPSREGDPDWVPPSREQFREWAEEAKDDPSGPSQQDFRDWEEIYHGPRRR